MQYSLTNIDIQGKEEWEVAILMQEMGDLGYETFEEEKGLLKAYIQTAQITDPWPYPTELCPDENWNATWEQDHPAEEVVPGVWIVPHCAFGAGHHETTRMMIDGIWKMEDGIKSKEYGIKSKESIASTIEVLDMGCGTGVLGIVAAKSYEGRVHVTMVDIDDKSVENTRENILLNGLPPEQFTLLCQGTVPAGEYDLILANIHRNILLAQLPDYARYLKEGGVIQMSGFYEEDVPVLIEAAEKEGLVWQKTEANGDWRMVVMTKMPTA